MRKPYIVFIDCKYRLISSKKEKKKKEWERICEQNNIDAVKSDCHLSSWTVCIRAKYNIVIQVSLDTLEFHKTVGITGIICVHSNRITLIFAY